MIKLIKNNGFKWKNKDNLWFKGYLYDGNRLKSEVQIFSELSQIKNKASLVEWLNTSNGCFSIVLTGDFGTLLAVDIMRTFPIFYSRNNNNWVVTDDPVSIFRGNAEVDPMAAVELECSGYVTGCRTLFNAVYQVQAGEIVAYSNHSIHCSFYADFRIDRIDSSKFNNLQQKLSHKLETVFERMVNSLDGRQVVLPLSGGYDSRLMATMLKKFGHKNVFTYTYGRAGNHELENSQRTATILGFPWVFIKYNSDLIQGFMSESTFSNYIHYVGKASSIFFMQEYFAVKFLHENNCIEKDAVFIPGFSGDALAGSHLRRSVAESVDKEKLIKQIYNKTYNQNNSIKFKNQFLHLIKDFVNQHSENIPTYNIYEQWLFKERHAKLIVNSASVFDFFGYEYRLPFWDRELVSFFTAVPFEYKLYKPLYNKTVVDCFFTPNNVAFEKEIQASPSDITKQKIKDKIRPYLPLKLKSHFLEKNDWTAYSLITEELMRDLKDNNIPYVFKADHYNSIISKWYVECIRKYTKE